MINNIIEKCTGGDFVVREQIKKELGELKTFMKQM